jgi:hypothetical protein
MVMGTSLLEEGEREGVVKAGGGGLLHILWRMTLG